jgi:ribosome maturation factor RimP
MEVFMISENEIYQAFDSYLKEENLELYDLNLVDFPVISRIEVYVYSSNTITLEVTSRLNKQFQRLLENMGIEKGSYDMVVSSPGIERKLKTFRHFEMAVGELVKVKTIEPINSIYSHEGIIHSANQDEILLEVNGEFLEIKFINIKNAKIEFKQFKEKVKG